MAERGEDIAFFTLRESVSLAATLMLNLACNIFAQHFSPRVGIRFALGGILCWLLSLILTALLRNRLTKHRVVAVVIAIFLLGFMVWTGFGSLRAYQRTITQKQDSGCENTGPATANGQGSIAISGCGNNLSGGKQK